MSTVVHDLANPVPDLSLMELDVRGAASLLRVSTKTIYRWIGDARIPGYRVNNRFRFDRSELLEWAIANRIPLDARASSEPPDARPIPRLDEALEAGGILYRVEGADRDAVLRNVVRVIRLEIESERELVVQALRAREELAPTAVGAGVAIPHLRNPLRVHLPRPTVTLCFLEQPVDWHALDGIPVRALLVVTAPTVRGVLRLHAQCLFALRDEEFREAVRSEPSREVLHSAARRAAERFHLPPGLSEPIDAHASRVPPGVPS